MNELRPNTRPDVSVLIPTRDRWELLSTNALPSALAQQDVAFEVLVIDDGSRDETAKHIAQLGDARIRLLASAPPGGQAAALNVGIREASADWVAFLDDDDLWSPTKLRAQIDAATAQAAAFAYGPAAMIDTRDGSVLTVDAPSPEDLARRLLITCALAAGSSTVMVRTDVARRLDGFDVRLAELADWDFWIRLALSERGAACAQTLVAYLVHPQNRRLVDRHDVFREFDYLAAKHAKAAAIRGVEFDRALFSKWVATGHLRAGRRAKAARVYLRSAVEDRSAGNLFRAGAALLGEWASFARARRTTRSLVRLLPRPLASRIPQRGDDMPEWLALPGAESALPAGAGVRMRYGPSDS